MFTVDPEIEAAREGMRRFNEQLAQSGFVLPSLDTPEQVAAVRAVPDALRAQQPVLPVQERVIAGPGGDLAVRVIVPEGHPRALYVDFHGGGFCIGWAMQHDTANALLARDAGIAMASVDYRLAPEHPYPAGPDDCLAGARWAIDVLAPELGCDRVVIGGDSAGGNLALRTAIALRDEGRGASLTALHLIYGVFDLSMTPSNRAATDTLIITRRDAEMFHAHYVPGASPEDLRAPGLSPLYADLRGLPPTLLLVGTADPLLDDSLFAHGRLCAAGVDAELLVFPEAPHGFCGFPSPYAPIAHRRAVSFLDRVLGA